MDIDNAIGYKSEILRAIETGDVIDPSRTEEAFLVILEFAEYYRNYLIDASND